MLVVFNNLNLPFIYRVHEAPDQEKVTDYSKFNKSLGGDIKTAQSKSLQLKSKVFLKMMIIIKENYLRIVMKMEYRSIKA